MAMATKRKPELSEINSRSLYPTNRIKTNEDSVSQREIINSKDAALEIQNRTTYENLKKAINKVENEKNSTDINTDSLKRPSRRKLKQTIKKAIKSDSISLLHPVCCGVDVHKDVMVACLRTVNQKGEKLEEIREFSGYTDDLLKMREWLIENDCPIVAMESTGVYWRPLHNVLEDSTTVILVNARHFKNVPGRKTDINDSKWLAELLQYGLLKGSFIPAHEVRDWRDLSRTRKKMIKDVGDYKRRTHKLFETANIKIDSVATDLFGVTGKNLMAYLCRSEKITLEGVEKCAKGQLRNKIPELYRSLQGFFRDHHRFEIMSFLKIINCLQVEIDSISTRLELMMADNEDLLSRLKDIPGIQDLSAQSVLSELGTDLSSFANENSLCSWAGVSPGNNQSAGKRYSGKSPVQKHPFKEILVEIAWSAVKKKGSFYREKYYVLKARRGAKKAIVAIAHRILKAIYFIIKHNAVFKDLGGDYLQKRRQKKKLSFLMREIKSLGLQVVPMPSNS